MIIPYSNSTHCIHGVSIRPSRTCASNLLADLTQPIQYQNQMQCSSRKLSNRNRHRCVPGAIHRIAFLQSPFNPHTSTALAA